MARLEQIVVLKFMGLSLCEIKDLLKAKQPALAETLERQRTVLTEKRRQLDAAILAIHRAKKTITNTGTSDWQQLAVIIKEITMQDDKKWMGKYFSEEAKQKIQERKNLWSPELQERATRQWDELFKDVEASLGEDPSSEKVQQLVFRWRALVNEFTEGDPQIQEGLNAMYRDMQNWPADAPQRSYAKPEIHAFMRNAMQYKSRAPEVEAGKT